MSNFSLFRTSYNDIYFDNNSYELDRTIRAYISPRNTIDLVTAKALLNVYLIEDLSNIIISYAYDIINTNLNKIFEQNDIDKHILSEVLCYIVHFKGFVVEPYFDYGGYEPSDVTEYSTIYNNYKYIVTDNGFGYMYSPYSKVHIDDIMS